MIRLFFICGNSILTFIIRFPNKPKLEAHLQEHRSGGAAKGSAADLGLDKSAEKGGDCTQCGLHIQDPKVRLDRQTDKKTDGHLDG